MIIFAFYNPNELKIELIIKENLTIVDKFRFSAKQFPDISKILYKKYGIRVLEIKGQDKDLAWIKKDVSGMS